MNDLRISAWFFAFSRQAVGALRTTNQMDDQSNARLGIS